MSCPGEPSRQRTGVALNLGKTATSQMSNWELGGSVRGCVMTRGRRWKEQGLRCVGRIWRKSGLVGSVTRETTCLQESSSFPL